MTRTRTTHTLAWTITLLAFVYLALTDPRQMAWGDVPVALAVVLAGIVLIRPVDGVPVVSVDDICARSRTLHPSSYRQSLTDGSQNHTEKRWIIGGNWPESEEGIER